MVPRLLVAITLGVNDTLVERRIMNVTFPEKPSQIKRVFIYLTKFIEQNLVTIGTGLHSVSS